jgi:hypothetical protein
MNRLSRFLVIFMVLAGVISGGVGVAAGRGPGDKPGKGCGDKHHTHYNEAECKHHHPKPDKHEKHDKK